jgi:hypothetical protein
MDNITNHSSTNIKPPNTEPDGQYVLCLEVWCSCCYHWLYCPSRSVFGGLMFLLLSLVILNVIDNITNDSNKNIKPPNTERDGQYNQS